MSYNVDFSVAAVVILAIIYVMLWLLYSFGKKRNTLFRRMVFCAIFMTLFNIITAITIEHGAEIAPLVNTVLNTIYFGVETFMVFLLQLYVKEYLDDFKPSPFRWVIQNVPIIIMAVMMVANMITGIVWGKGAIFYFDAAGSYIKGPAYMTVFVIPAYYLFYAAIMIVVFRKAFSFKQVMTFAAVVFVATLAILVQLLFFPQILLNDFAIAMALLIAIFSLETPDYVRLIKTMEDLEEANQKTQEANRAKSIFLARMSHEIRTPLNGVLGMDEIILKSDITPEIRECALGIQSSGQSLMSIINDILDISKIESGKTEIVNAEYSPVSLIQDTYCMMRVRAEEKRLELTVEANPEIPALLEGDEVHLRQIFVNLLSNAVKYTDRGTITWKVDFEKDEEDGIRLICAIRDTGIGIRPEDMEKIFDTFSRVDVGRNRWVEGTGLGLGICKQLAELMGGQLTVDSEYGKGSVFTVTIPQKILSEKAMGELHFSLVEGEQANAGEQKQQAQLDPAALKGHILVVDDVEMNLKVLKGLLRDTSLTVDTCTSGDEALELIKTETYDVILLDHMMPGKDGVETLAEMKQLPEQENPNAATPVIMLTANAIQGAKEEYLAAGFVDYLSKPIKAAILKETLAKYLLK